jgi:hypothetical protein
MAVPVAPARAAAGVDPHCIERLIRQSIPAEDRRSGAGRLDNRPRMCIQSGRTLAALPSVTKAAHVGGARRRRGAATGITNELANP